MMFGAAFLLGIKRKQIGPTTSYAIGGENMEKAKEFTTKADLTSQEWQLIQMIRAMEYGQLTVTVKASKPIHVDEIRKSIPLK